MTYVQPTDPGAVGKGQFWLTPGGSLYVRNTPNAAWLQTCVGVIDPTWNHVPTQLGGTFLTATAIAPGFCSGDSVDRFLFYIGATYELTGHLEPHHDGALQLSCVSTNITSVGGPPGVNITPNGGLGGCESLGGPPTPNVYDSVVNGVVSGPAVSALFKASVSGSPYLDAGACGSIYTVSAIYVSGPDPRFENGPQTCP